MSHLPRVSHMSWMSQLFQLSRVSHISWMSRLSQLFRMYHVVPDVLVIQFVCKAKSIAHMFDLGILVSAISRTSFVNEHGIVSSISLMTSNLPGCDRLCWIVLLLWSTNLFSSSLSCLRHCSCHLWSSHGDCIRPVFSWHWRLCNFLVATPGKNCVGC